MSSPRSMKGRIDVTERAADAIGAAIAGATFWTTEMLKANNYGWAVESARVVDQLAIALSRLKAPEEPA